MSVLQGVAGPRAHRAQLVNEAIAGLQRAWARSDAIFALLADPTLLVRPIALRHPFLFYLGHLPAFASKHVLSGLLQRPPLHGAFEVLFERGIDPLSDDDVESDASRSWPQTDEVLAYRDRVRATIVGSVSDLLSCSNPGPHLALHLVLEHELMHHETLLYMLLAMPAHEKVRPAGFEVPVAAPHDGSDSERIELPHGVTRLGTTLEQVVFAWDNELSETPVSVDAFGLDRSAVTIAQFQSFIVAGGYENEALWKPDDWSWKCAMELQRPWSWCEVDGVEHARWLFGTAPLATVGAWPVQVSQAEASAYARWRGARLPTEAELAWAAHGPCHVRTPTPSAALNPAHRLGTSGFVSPHSVHTLRTPSVFGVDQLTSNGWEWTSTPFRPLPGFDTWHKGYPGYSSDFFDERHFVVFGGSWATDSTLMRRSFRNWYQGHYPHVFSKFRLAW